MPPSTRQLGRRAGDDRGELIGINTAILANGSEGNQGIRFCVPSVWRAIDGARSSISGKVTRAYLGVMAQEVRPPSPRPSMNRKCAAR